MRKEDRETDWENEWMTLTACQPDDSYFVGCFLCLMAYQLFLGYLMPKPFS